MPNSTYKLNPGLREYALIQDTVIRGLIKTRTQKMANFLAEFNYNKDKTHTTLAVDITDRTCAMGIGDTYVDGKWYNRDTGEEYFPNV